MTDDQRFAERRPDVLTFKTDVLKEDVTVTGNVIADIMTSISTTDADFVVKVIDVFPDDLGYNSVIFTRKRPGKNYPMGGYEMLVRSEIFRGDTGKVMRRRLRLPRQSGRGEIWITFCRAYI